MKLKLLIIWKKKTTLYKDLQKEKNGVQNKIQFKIGKRLTKRTKWIKKLKFHVIK